MRVGVRDRYGSPDVVEIRDVEIPEPAEDEMLVHVRASSVNIADWYGVAGRPLVGRAAMGAPSPVLFIAKLTREDLAFLRLLLESGTITPLVDRSYRLDDVGDALRYIGEGHCRSKIAITT